MRKKERKKAAHTKPGSTADGGTPLWPEWSDGTDGSALATRGSRVPSSRHSQVNKPSPAQPNSPSIRLCVCARFPLFSSLHLHFIPPFPILSSAHPQPRISRIRFPGFRGVLGVSFLSPSSRLSSRQSNSFLSDPPQLLPLHSQETIFTMQVRMRMRWSAYFVAV